MKEGGVEEEKEQRRHQTTSTKKVGELRGSNVTLSDLFAPPSLVVVSSLLRTSRRHWSDAIVLAYKSYFESLPFCGWNRTPIAKLFLPYSNPGPVGVLGAVLQASD